MFAILGVGLLILLPILAIVSIGKWIFTGKSLLDWIDDCYLDTLVSDIFFGSIDKIIEYKK